MRWWAAVAVLAVAATAAGCIDDERRSSTGVRATNGTETPLGVLLVTADGDERLLGAVAPGHELQLAPGDLISGGLVADDPGDHLEARDGRGRVVDELDLAGIDLRPQAQWEISTT